MTVSALAEACGVGVATIKRLEAFPGVPPAQVRTLLAIKEALESAGVEFTGTPDDRPGVCLRVPPLQPDTVKRTGGRQ